MEKSKVTISLEEVGNSLDTIRQMSGTNLPFVQAFLFSENVRELQPIAQNFVEKRGLIVKEVKGEGGTMTLDELGKRDDYKALIGMMVDVELYVLNVLDLGSGSIPTGVFSTLYYMFTMAEEKV